MKSRIGRDIALTISSLSLMVAGFILLVYLPGKRTCDEYQKQINAADGQIRQIPVKVAELESLQNELIREQAALLHSNRLMTDRAELHDVIREVADLAQAADLEVTRLQPLAAVEHESYDAIPFQMSLSGRFFAVARFVRGLEGLERLFTIQELSLTNDDRRNPEIVEGDVYFSVYVHRTDSSDSVEINGS